MTSKLSENELENWVGKTFIRKDNTNNIVDTTNYIFESNLPQPYRVLWPGHMLMTRDFRPDRLNVKLNEKDVIERVWYV